MIRSPFIKTSIDEEVKTPANSNREAIDNVFPAAYNFLNNRTPSQDVWKKLW